MSKNFIHGDNILFPKKRNVSSHFLRNYIRFLIHKNIWTIIPYLFNSPPMRYTWKVI